MNFFLKGVLGAPLPVVATPSVGKNALVLGGECAEAARQDGYVIAAANGVVRIAGDDDDVAAVDATAALPDEAPWQPCFRRGTLFGVYAFLC